MTRVWSHCKAGANSNLKVFTEFENGNVNGWNHCVNFDTLGELVDRLNELGLSGRISRLAINCHGGAGGGIVQLDRTLSVRNLSGFEVDLRRLANFMDRGIQRGRSKLIFMGCATGSGVDGTDILRAISEIFVDITVIGFEVTTEQIHADGLTLAAGDIWISRYIVNGTDHVRAGPFHPAAKWVHNNIVLRYPLWEQKRRPNNRCAYPRCPGHQITHPGRADTHDQCDGGWHPACEWRGIPRTTPVPSIMDYLRPEEYLLDTDDIPSETRWYHRQGKTTVQAVNKGFIIPRTHGGKE